MKKAFFALSLCLIIPVLYAEDGTGKSSEIVLQVSSLPGTKLGFTERFYFPFLRGQTPLTEGNNIELAPGVELSPISVNGTFDAVWTPIAFFQLSAGGMIGSGWNLNLFNTELHGIGLNRADADGNAEYSGSAFDGLLWKAKTGLTLRMDFAALYPGDWHHIVFSTYHEISHKRYTRAAQDESWYFENDEGENRDGVNYYGNLLIGYQMPLMLNLIGLLAETNIFLYSNPDYGRWGGNIPGRAFSAIFNLEISKKIDITLLAQLKIQKNFKESNWKDIYYQNRTIDDSKPVSLKFYQAVTVLTYKFQ